METLVKEKILEQFVKEIPRESATIQPINVDIKSTNVSMMTNINTMKTNDGNYFIRYGGFPLDGAYNAIEVYSVNSLDNNEAVYVFDDLEIDGHTVYIVEMKQAEDGRFYGIGEYLVPNVNSYSYLIIFNNFIQDGYCKINKYYTETNMGANLGLFQNVAKAPDAGIYFITAVNKLIRFEINILEGNKTSVATIVDGGDVTDGSYQPQLNVLGDKLIFTKLWNVDVTPSDYPAYTKYEYTKAVVNINEELPNTITLNQVYTTNIQTDGFIDGTVNQPFEAIIPYLISGFIPSFVRVRLDGTIVTVIDWDTQIFPLSDPYFYIQEDFAALSNNGQLYLFYFKEDKTKMYNFYTTTFSKYFEQYEVLRQYDMLTLIGLASLGTQQSIVSIKNIYSPNTTSLPYYTDIFCLPAYMNLYSDSNDNTSLIFSRDATARFYSGNQVTSTFIVPNYLLNDGNIEKASVYGKTNYLLNDTINDYEKNRFESLYFNFIYSLNVIDNTNGLNTLNQTGSNRIADTLWESYIPMFSRLSKARITYEDLSTEIIQLNLVSLIGGTATFNYQVNGNITKIEYLSEDEKTVYSTYRGQITGAHTITQVVKIIPNETATLSGTSIYISDSSNLTFANIQISGNSVQNGTPTSTSPVLIKNAGDAKNLYYLPEAGSSSEITYSINEDGTINLSGTATDAVTFPIFKSIAEAQIENGATYTFSSNQALPSGVEFRAEAFNDTSWLRHLIGSVLDSSHQVFTGTANTTNATRIRHLIYIASGTNVNITNLGIQFEKGNTQTSFTPEGKGFINETISNKNLFDKNNPNILNAFVNGNTGLLTAPTNNQKSIAVRLQANTTYTISGVERASSNYGLFDDVTLTIGTSIATQKANITNGKRTITTGNNTKWLVFLLGGGTETYGYNNVQIEVGSTETSFIQHQEQSFIIPCQQPMRSIGDIRDGFVKQDGVWYEKHNLRQRILNGNENWISQTQTGFYRYGLTDSVINNETSYASQVIIKSDSFKGITFNNRNSDTNETIYAVSNGQQHNLFINTNSYTTLNDFKNWLTGNNIEVIYLLNEPNYIECTQEQIEDLESIIRGNTYEPITNINSTDETPAYLNVTYYKQL